MRGRSYSSSADHCSHRYTPKLCHRGQALTVFTDRPVEPVSYCETMFEGTVTERLLGVRRSGCRSRLDGYYLRCQRSGTGTERPAKCARTETQDDGNRLDDGSHRGVSTFEELLGVRCTKPGVSLMMVSISYKINFQFVVSIRIVNLCAFTSRYFSCILIDGAEGDACCLIGLL
jgi:hypothetical protein